MEKQNAFSRRSVKVAFVLFFCFRYLAAYDLWDRQAVGGEGRDLRVLHTQDIRHQATG